jgi:hypothetical protein
MLGHLQEVFKQTFEIAERQRDWPVQHSITNVVTAEGWQEMLQFVRFGSSADILRCENLPPKADISALARDPLCCNISF